MRLKEKCEKLFEVWGYLMYRWRWLVLALCLALNLGLSLAIPEITVDNSHESFLRDGDPAGERYKQFRRQFGQDSLVLIALTPPEVFSFPFLEKLRRFHHELETLPHIADVTSLVNARQTRGEGDTLVVEDLLGKWPEDAAALAELKQRVLASRSYRDYLISTDGTLATVVIRPATYAESDASLENFDTFDSPGREPEFLGVDGKTELVDALDKIVAKYDGPDFPIHLSGGSVVGARLNEMMRSDVTKYMATCSAVILLLLAILFRRFSGVLLPLLLVIVSLLSTFGCLALMGIPFSMTLQMLPVFVMCVAVCDAIHVLVLVYQRMADGSDKQDAIGETFAHSGLAILMTSLTTAAGMLSFVNAEIAPIGYLGILSAVGVAFAFVYTMTFIPALIGILPIRRLPSETSGTGKSVLSRILVWAGDVSTARPGIVLTVSAGILLWSLIGFAQLRFAHDPVSWFPKGHPVRTALELMDSKLGGSQSIEVVVDSGRENGLQDPDALNRFERAMAATKKLERGDLYVGKTVSLTEVVKETNRALHENDPSFYSIPTNRNLVAQELLLFENSGSDDLEMLTDSQFRLGRISLRVPMVDAIYYPTFLKDVRAALAKELGEKLPFEITGIAPLFGRIFLAMIHSMARSYVIALALITPLMILLIGSLRLGLISMVPNLLPVVFILGFMGWFGFPLDISSVVIGSILIGLAVDDTIHFMHRCQRNLESGADVATSVHRTMQTTGTAMLCTSLVLGAGFFSIGAMGTMTNTVHFGFLSAIGIMAAFVADIFISPALVSLVMRRRNHNGAAEWSRTTTG